MEHTPQSFSLCGLNCPALGVTTRFHPCSLQSNGFGQRGGVQREIQTCRPRGLATFATAEAVYIACVF